MIWGRHSSGSTTTTSCWAMSASIPRWAFTAIFTIATTAIQTVLGLILALLLNRNIRGEGLVRTLLLIPWLTAPFISGFNFRFMMAPNIGVIAQALDFLGFDCDHSIFDFRQPEDSSRRVDSCARLEWRTGYDAGGHGRLEDDTGRSSTWRPVLMGRTVCKSFVTSPCLWCVTRF